MKNSFYFLTLAFICFLSFSACKKSDPSNPSNPTTTDSATSTKVCYNASGNLDISGMGLSSITANIACTNYDDHTSLFPNYYTTHLTIGDQLQFGQMVTFRFQGKSWPKSGTYKVVTPNGSFGKWQVMATDEVEVIFFGHYSNTDDGNTIEVVNDNGKITLKSSKINLYDVAKNFKSAITNLNFTKETTKK